jgi:hypothetical protein
MFDRKAYMKEYNKNYRQGHKEEHNQGNREYRKAHPDRVKLQKENWSKVNPEYFKRYGLKQYGLTLEQFNQRIEDQNNACKLCRQPFGENKALHPVVDHNHITNEIRGILHRSCNSALGLFGDTLAGAEKAVAYLQGSFTEQVEEHY